MIEKRELQITADGSHTLFVPAMDEHYHSVNGAIQESEHVFIEAGFRKVEAEHIRVLEIGFGTGLNAFLTLRESENRQKSVEYFSVERYPLDAEIIDHLNYGSLIWPEKKELFRALHTAEWDKPVAVTGQFTLYKIEGDSTACDLPDNLDLIYFDAFAPDKQPEMWTPAVFDRLAALTKPGGVMVTYCAKGEVRRSMQAAGFKMERLPGPPGKRHMLFGVKL